MKQLIRFRKTKMPPEMRYLPVGVARSIVVQPHIAAFEACGWFVIYEKKRTDKSNLMLTSVETEYHLRDEGVPDGCFFKNNQEFSCGVCKQII